LFAVTRNFDKKKKHTNKPILRMFAVKF